jgi:GNAT superfamily N-acetyltransferase
MFALRPHLIENEFVTRVTRMQEQGYKLAFVAESADAPALAVIGYRHLDFLFNGPHIYVDDLSTLPAARSKGCASQLLEFVFEEARQHGYQSVTLDSGHARHDAHRLYLSKKFKMIAHHFSNDRLYD